MKKTFLYLFLLAILGGITYFFMIRKAASTIAVDERNFAVEDTSRVGKMILTDHAGKRIELTRSAAGWKLNGTESANEEMTEQLLGTLKKIKLKFPVADAAHNNVMKELSAHSVQVEVLDLEGVELKSFFVGGPTNDHAGTYMLMKGSDNPMVVWIEGFEGYLSTRFQTDKNAWRSHSIFRYTIADLKSIEVNYAGQPDSSFIIHIIGVDSFQIAPVGKKINHPANKLKLDRYISLLKKINCESFENENSLKDSVMNTTPICEISVLDRSGNRNQVTVWHKPVSERTLTPYDNAGRIRDFDPDYFFAAIRNRKDFVMVQQFHFGRLMQSYSWFFKL